VERETVATFQNDGPIAAPLAVCTDVAAFGRPEVAAPPARADALARNAPCPCGSTRRHKHCCGQLDAAAAALPQQQIALMCRGAEHMLRGEGTQAAALLARLRPEQIHDVLMAREAGEMSLDLHLLEPAQAFLERALLLRPDDDAARHALRDCTQHRQRAQLWHAASLRIRERLTRCAVAAKGVSRAPCAHVHVVSKLDTIGGTERRAMNLYRWLSARVPTTLWSTQAPHPQHAAAAPIRCIEPGAAPNGGTLALVGTYFPCGDWLESAAFQRVVVSHNTTEQHDSLEQRLAQLERNPSRPPVQLTFPSSLFRAATNLPGLVEYTPLDLEAFQRRRTSTAIGSVTIGRHGRADLRKFHPNDAALFRTLLSRGHAVRVLGGTPLSPAFATDRGARPELLELGAQSAAAFLDSLDVFLYRKHPAFFETCGSVIMEAMAMQLPVVVFPGDVGAAELIRDGENGFLVDSESAALARIEQLAADPALRARLGRAARATIDDCLRRQHVQLLATYLGP